MAKKKSKSKKSSRKAEHKRSENLLFLSSVGIVVLTAYGLSLVFGESVTTQKMIQYTVIMDMVPVMIGLIALLFLNRIHESIIGVEEDLD